VRIRSLRSPRCDVVGRVRHGAAQEGPLQPPVSRGSPSWRPSSCPPQLGL
jgi:hypothetical protein